MLKAGGERDGVSECEGWRRGEGRPTFFFVVRHDLDTVS